MASRAKACHLETVTREMALRLCTPQAEVAARLVRPPKRVRTSLQDGILKVEGGGPRKLRRLASLIGQMATDVPVVPSLLIARMIPNGPVIVKNAVRCPECGNDSEIMFCRDEKPRDTTCLRCGYNERQDLFGRC
ncbi:MAG: hypothetical protein A2126_02190 [Candidatus Woykebacteria bacterium GWB1_45_5]|uniref:Uncharacterized protein n=2 Tax=Candidatus Woykeibacteriota TaxID=1817899 RepID=A0A1G1W332_9BACT|nr:MAG: hypothetical protein A2113_02610 [Candidatus Woykebacteria bacterium GWA1_44_8]OGY23940.1 MAG: hypothetical protein A2126_02190 [Candidatus Woykebacteria bacterium GWB1_45_5]